LQAESLFAGKTLWTQGRKGFNHEGTKNTKGFTKESSQDKSFEALFEEGNVKVH